MCSVCLKTPCHPACPNAEEPKPVMLCMCGNGIYTGDQYLEDINGKYHCMECLKEMEVSDILKLAGLELSKVEEEM